MTILLVNKENQIKCQKHLFKMGYIWQDGDKNVSDILGPDDSEYVIVLNEKKDTFSYSTKNRYKSYDIINFDDYLRKLKLKRINGV